MTSMRSMSSMLCFVFQQPPKTRFPRKVVFPSVSSSNPWKTLEVPLTPDDVIFVVGDPHSSNGNQQGSSCQALKIERRKPGSIGTRFSGVTFFPAATVGGMYLLRTLVAVGEDFGGHLCRLGLESK